VKTREEFRPADDEDRAWLKALVEKANGGDGPALTELRAFLDENPRLWHRLGDMGAHAEAAWIELIANGDRLVAESVKREADRLREELRGETPGPVERLLADQIVVSHLRLQYLQTRAADSPGVTKGQQATLARQLDGARNGYLSALKTLALVRKLGAGGRAGTRLRVFAAAEGA
jgi:hypothetical protein